MSMTPTPEQPSVPVTPTGDQMEQMKALAHNYQVPMSEESIKGIVDASIGEPEAKAKAFEGYLSTMAQGLYPTLAPQIKAGIPTAYLLEPYRQVAKQVLGQQFEPDFIGNTRHSAALSGQIDQATGRPAPMSLDQWTKYLKTEPSFDWRSTEDGDREYQRVHQQLKQIFGESR